ncbi:MAG TPA: chitobiase/beta-hexosaminidase C-terminal domain-containing protein, partial [Thermoanaerobaculia bacterium]|nr:chitobiase/beta-hexosaminidase C-terminal domain-containing protein [Thermoanaerobaculia bacterium]
GLDFADGITVFDQEPGIFRPANSISRAWAVKALLEAWNIPPLTSFSGITLFSDVPTSHPAAGYIYQAKQMGIVTGTNGLFVPDGAAARQDIFLLLHRTLDRQANVNAVVIPSPAPLSRDDFAETQPLRQIGVRYEQPVLWGVLTPGLDLTAGPLTRETIGPLANIYTATFEAVLSGVDDRTFVDSQGTSHQAHPFCAWSATSGSFVDLTPAGGVPFSRVRWLAPADVSAASGTAAEFAITAYCGDDLGSEVSASRSLFLSSRSDDSTLPTVSLSALPAGKTGGQLLEIQGSARDGGDLNAANFGILRVEVFASLDQGVSWDRLGEASLDAQGGWDFAWLLPPFSGTVRVRASATNLRGNSAQTEGSLSILPVLALTGSVSDGGGQPVENALVTVSGGNLSASVAADNQGTFRFSSAEGTALQTGVSYTLSASFAGRSTSTSGLTLTSQAPSLDQALTLDLAPPVTAAAPPGGTYAAPQSVTLFCVDDSAGCSATYYTVDGTVPSTSSPRATAPIQIQQSTTLRFFSIDGAGNRENVVTEPYVFATCSFAIDPTSGVYDGNGGFGLVAVTAPGGCPWTAASSQGWITFTSSPSGNRNGTVGFSVAANPGTAPRTGTLTIAGRTFSVSQSGAGTVTFTLTVNKLGSGSGRVTSMPAGIDCGTGCSKTFPAGSQVSLQAVSDAGSGPVVWGGDPDCADGAVTLSADRLCTATFELQTVCSSNWTSGGPYGGYVQRVVIDPSAPNHLYAAGLGGLFESQDGGESWISTGLGDRYVEALVMDPSAPASLYAGSGVSVFKSTDGGRTWSESSTGLGNSQISSLAIDAASPSTLYAGLSTLGVFKSTDRGAHWSALNIGVSGAMVNALAVDPADSRTVYAGLESAGVLKSTDGGATWAGMNNGLTSLAVRGLWIDRRSSSTLLASTLAGIHRSSDGGRTWTPLL